MTISTLLIANRGEIAVRVIRAARKLGIKTVQAHSSADADMLAVREADEAVEIGPPQPARSYLNCEAVIKAALQSGADAIHPGYGFLSENAGFAESVANAGLVFVGPDAATIRMMGDKSEARKRAQAAGVPIVEGFDASGDDALEQAGKTGFPVMIKASAGGGGRGIRIVDNANDFKTQAAEASSEAQAAFGDGTIYVEKFIPAARHIEVQILGDGRNVVHCGERECSLQRRRQKVWEEAPSTALNRETRKKLCDCAVALARSVNYKGAGTIEYLYDGRTEEFYFIEMNTRIQVEHPVTEMVTGLDLVAEMIRIAGGADLSVGQDDITFNGNALEVRINAEDPANDFMPFPGVVSGLRIPSGDGVRFDHTLFENYAVPPFYDSLLGKLVIHGENRRQALERLEKALAVLKIDGLPCTAPLFSALLRETDVRENAVHTEWLEQWLVNNSGKIIKESEVSA